jgi:hypothetical protein
MKNLAGSKSCSESRTVFSVNYNQKKEEKKTLLEIHIVMNLATFDISEKFPNI